MSVRNSSSWLWTVSQVSQAREVSATHSTNGSEGAVGEGDGGLGGHLVTTRESKRACERTTTMNTRREG